MPLCLQTEENTSEKENIVKATLTIGSSQTNKELMTNISTLLLKYKEQKNGKILAVDSCKTLPARQRHSKSLDQLKNTGVHTNQVPITSNSITRSTSSQMPYNKPISISKPPFKNYLKVEINTVNNSGEATSPSTDSGDSEACKKLEPSLSAPYSLCEYPVIKTDFCLSNGIKHSESTLSMPNTNGSSNERLKDNVKFLIGSISESMPNLIQTPSDSPKGFNFISSRFNYKKLSDNKDILALYEVNDSTIFEETSDDHCTVLETKSPKRGKTSKKKL